MNEYNKEWDKNNIWKNVDDYVNLGIIFKNEIEQINYKEQDNIIKLPKYIHYSIHSSDNSNILEDHINKQTGKLKKISMIIINLFVPIDMTLVYHRVIILMDKKVNWVCVGIINEETYVNKTGDYKIKREFISEN